MVRGSALLAVIAGSLFAAAAAAQTSFTSVTTVVASKKGDDILKSPAALAVVHKTGDIIVADRAHHRLLRISVAGAVTILAGSGKPGNANGSGTQAELKEPAGVAIDEVRRIIYVADSGNHLIRAVTFDGVTTTLAGSGKPEDRDGTGVQAAFKQPSGIAVDATGVIYVADTGNSRIKQITPAGAVTTLAGDVHEGLADGPAGKAQFKQPEGVAIAPDGSLLISDTKNNMIRVLRAGVVSTLAGTGHGGYADGAGNLAELKEPSGIACDDSGNVLVADSKNHAIRRITLNGTSVTVSTVTGLAKPGYSDGQTSVAQFREPGGVAFAGAIYVADTGNDALRRIDSTVSLSKINPRSGLTTGGTEVHLLGSGFVPGMTQVTFGGTNAIGVFYLTSAEIVATTPALNAGVFDVVATTPGGSATLTGAYSTAPPPTIATVSPRKGKAGDVVTITGTNFIAGATVKFGSAMATSATTVTSNTITAVVPPLPAGTVDLTVTTNAGTATKPSAFTDFAAPIIATFSPMQGASGTVVTIGGANFDTDPSGDVVSFGGRVAVVTTVTNTQLVVTAPSGTMTGRISVTTAGGTATSATDFTVAAYNALELTSPVVSFDQDAAIPMNAIARMSDGSGTDVSAQATWTTSDAGVATVVRGLVTGRAAGSATITATFNGFTASKTIAIQPATIPVLIPTTIDRTIVQPFADQFRFLYSGSNAVQTNVAANAIVDDRLTTVRGSVHGRDGAPLSGVEITIANHPELGHTFTRADGVFDLVINGGGTVTLVYRKSGWIEAQRMVSSLWNEQKIVDDVVLVSYDANVTLVSMGNPSVQVARGSQTNDADGIRTATLIIPANEAATVTTTSGTATASVLHIRATEYTVGANGPSAMPAALPPYSGYTYCVELGADEVPAGNVKFAKPLAMYTDNFLGIPGGAQIPVGYYDRAKSTWMSANNARVIRIISINNGVAAIDADGDGAVDSAVSLLQLGIDDAELRTLGSLYAPGKSLWRSSIDHFTPWDVNLALHAPADARAPKRAKGKGLRAGKTRATCRLRGWSVIDCANQTLGESISIQGTPYSLEYDSSRAGQVRYTTDIELSGATVPASLKRIDLEIVIAGEDHRLSFPPQPNQTYTFTWDGRDGFGRAVQGARVADITVTYVYPMLYTPTTAVPGWDVPSDWIAAAIQRAGDFKLTDEEQIFLGHYDAAGAGFGGWSFSGQRLYDGIGRALYEPDGHERAADPLQTHETAIGTLTTGSTTADLWTMAPAPDGSLYFSDRYKLKRRFSDGTTVDIAGSGRRGFTADGFDVLGNPIDPWQIALGPDGTLYMVEGSRVRAIVNGKWVTAAGNDQYERGGEPEGVQATSRAITPYSLALGPDGSLYIGSMGRIFKVGIDGILHTIAGQYSASGALTDFDDGVPASSVMLGTISGVAIGSDGTVYFANDTIAGKMTPDGRVFHIATGASRGAFDPHGISVANDGTVLLTDINGRRVWEITPDGAQVAFAGTGQCDTGASLAAIGVSRGYMLCSPQEAKIMADGSVVILDWWFEQIRKASSSLPPIRSASATVIPSEDGSVAYVFEGGRHTRTVDTLTNVTLETLGYDANGNPASITDLDGLVTTIERNTAGDVTGIVAPNGQRTALTTSNGYLTQITEPGGSHYDFGYDANGLLSQLTDRRRGVHTFTYDENGLLQRDNDPLGGFISLTRSGTGQTFSVQRTTAESRIDTFATAVDAAGVEQHTHTGSDGLPVTTRFYAGTTSVTSALGSAMSTDAADVRWGMLAPLASSVIVNGSKTVTTSEARTTTLANPNDVLSMTAQTESFTINGRTWTSAWNAATRQLTARSPLGRQSSATLDAKGRPVLYQLPSLAGISVTYDTRGRAATLSQGTRTTTFAYDGFDRVQSITDSLHRTAIFEYDAANRITSETLPGGRTIGFTYDEDDNLTSVTPPSRPSHGFTFTAIGLTNQYTPPAVPNGGITKYAYNKDRQLTLITRPDAQTIAFAYDTAGRLATLTTPDTTLTNTYDALGRLSSVSNSSGVSTAYGYDGSMLTSQSWTGEVSGSVGYTYDSDVRLASENGITLSYDADDLLTGAGALTLKRDAQSGMLTGTTLGIVSDAWTYNELGEPMTYAVTLNGSEALREEYTRDDAGRITQIVESTGGHSSTTGYTYDEAGHLAAVSHDGQRTASYTYDANGNRAGGTYDDQDRLLSLHGVTYTYTSNGELATKTDVNGTTTYTYDTLGNLRTVVLPDGRRIDYVIDAQNRRVGKKVNGVLTTGWLYADQLRIVAETDGTGTVTKQFVYGSRANVPDYMIANGVTYRIVTDHLGSPRYVIESGTGTVVATMTFDEFGNVLSEEGSSLVPFGFAGGLRDKDTGLIRFGARDYDPQVGRWTAKDPIRFAGDDGDLYVYVGNDPINFIDPSGLDQLTADPHVQEMIKDLWEKSGWGMKPQEQAAWITLDPQTGKYGCVRWPQTHESNSLSLKKGSAIPTNTVAIIHTHPVQDRTQLPDDEGDRKVAHATHLPIYTITKLNGVGKYDPKTDTATKEEQRIDFPNAAKDKCACQ